MKTLFTLLIILLLMFTACQQVDNNNSSGSEDVLGEHGGLKLQAQAIAEKFFRESPTYAFDGSNLELISSQTDDCVNVCGTFVFTFTLKRRKATSFRAWMDSLSDFWCPRNIVL